jgi:putative ABC transport system permease protein
MDDMLGTGLAEFQTMDYNVNFRQPVAEKVIFDIPNHLTEVNEIEGKVECPVKLTNAQHEISLNLVGVAQDTIFYNFKTKDGRPVAMPEEGVLISDYAASKLGVAVGDRVLLHSYLRPDADDVPVEVSGIIYQAMGVGAYMDKTRLARDFLSPGTVTGCYINSEDTNAAASLMQLPGVSSVISIGSLASIMEEYVAIMNITMVFMLALSGLLGFAIVYNTTIISIGERETEFSSLRVLGFSRGDIFRLVLKENNFITVLGILVGLPLANLFLLYSADIFSTEQYTMVMRASIVNYLQGIAATAFFIILAQFATYKKIQGLDFMAALKNRA